MVVLSSSRLEYPLQYCSAAFQTAQANVRPAEGMKSRGGHQGLGGNTHTHVRSRGGGLVSLLYLYIIHMYIIHIYDYTYYILSTYISYIYISYIYISYIAPKEDKHNLKSKGSARCRLTKVGGQWRGGQGSERLRVGPMG